MTEKKTLENVLKNTETPWGEIGYITFKRTYARRIREDDKSSPTEEFPQTVKRVIDACRTQLRIGFTEEEEIDLAEILLKLKGMVAGRFLWQLGTKTVKKLGLLSLQNCAFAAINHPLHPFTWAFESLMLGVGDGFSIEREHVYQLPKLKNKVKITRLDTADCDFIVPDNREGWVKLLGKVIKAHFYSGKGFTYSTQLIRGKGAPISGFGGVAAGPEELCAGIDKISEILNNRSGQKLRPIDCLDIMNIIGSIVVAGNVRRSAEICIGDYDDIDYLKAKRWDLGIPNWRSMSNNSVSCDDTSKLLPQFWDTYQSGEPYGLINLKLARTCGRIGDTQYPDPEVLGVNPCAEQMLANYETCCLSDVFLPNIDSQEELFKVLKYLYRINKHSLALPCHLKETELIVHKNMRMGIGITGLCQSSEKKLSWLSEGYEYLRQYDNDYSEVHGFPRSIKLTTVKPSGTLSLLAGVTPGAHASPAGPYYVRRIRMSSNSSLVSLCRENGYKTEFQRQFDGTIDPTTIVVEFPCKVPEGTAIAGQQTAVQQLDFVKWLQTNWSDNAVSCTIYYRLNELPEIKMWLEENYASNIKSVSFLLYNDHGFSQAPYETISKEEYENMSNNVNPISSASFTIEDIEVTNECEKGACPIK